MIERSSHAFKLDNRGNVWRVAISPLRSRRPEKASPAGLSFFLEQDFDHISEMTGLGKHEINLFAG